MIQNRRGFFATVAGLASIPLLGKIPMEKVPALLTPGEFVVSRKFIESLYKRYGGPSGTLKLLNQINRKIKGA